MVPKVAQLVLLPILLIANSKWTKPNRNVRSIQLLNEANASASALPETIVPDDASKKKALIASEAGTIPAGEDMHESIKLFHECDGNTDEAVTCTEATACFQVHGSDAADFAEQHKVFVNGITEMCEEDRKAKLSLARAKELLGILAASGAEGNETALISKAGVARALLTSRRDGSVSKKSLSAIYRATALLSNDGKVSQKSQSDVLEAYGDDKNVERCVESEIVNFQEEHNSTPNATMVFVLRETCRKEAKEAVESSGAGAFTKYDEWGKITKE